MMHDDKKIEEFKSNWGKFSISEIIKQYAEHMVQQERGESVSLIKELRGYFNDSSICNAVYVEPAQMLRNQADELESKENLLIKKYMNKPKYNRETQQHELNGIIFRGHFAEWKMEYIPKTYLKQSHFSGDEYRKGGSVKIYLNDECVSSEFCREPERALMIMSKNLHLLQCHFELRDIYEWKKELNGKKVFHGGIPSTVTSILNDGMIIVKRDDGKDFAPDLYPSLFNDPDYENEWHDTDKVHITDSRISWNRN